MPQGGPSQIITKDTPGAVWDPGRPGGQGGGTPGFYRTKTREEISRDVLAQDAAAIAAGPPAPGMVFGHGTVWNPMNNALATPGGWGYPSTKGFFGDLLEGIAGIGKTVAPIALTALGANYLLPSLMGTAGAAGAAGAGGAGAAGAGALGADALLASELAAYPTAGIVGSVPAAAGLTGIGVAAPTGFETAAADLLSAAGAGAGAGLTSLAPEILTAGSAPGALAATLPAYVAPTAAELVAAGTTAGGTLTTGLGNEAVASGVFTPGSVGSVANAAGVLTPTQVAVAAGLPDLTSLTGADAVAAKLAASGNEAVASGMSPGSVGAAQAAAGMLTPEQLAAAYGVNSGLSALDGLKVPKPSNNSNGADLMKQGLSLINNTTNVGGNSSQALQSTGLSSLAPNSQSNLLKELVQLYPQMSNVNPQTMAAISPYYRMQEIPQTHMPAEEPQSYAKGGLSRHRPEFITGATGHYVKGRGDGQSDDIPAMLADGEYVFDADTVASLGNGSSDAGAKRLDKMREAIRKHKRSAPIHKIPPKAKSPLEYLKG